MFLIAVALFPSTAAAHVKWFAPYDVPAQPELLSAVFSATFGELVAAAMIGLWLLCLIERTALGGAVLRAIERYHAHLRPRTEDLMRGMAALFFIALFTVGNLILTPELKTDLPAIPWLQCAIALLLFWRSTMVLAAAGIAALWAYGVYTYGIFHLLDYPIFLGLAVYYALTGLGERRLLGLRPIDFARWGAAITLMWASVEKWAYPQWTDPLLQAHPTLCMGFNSEFYMVAAGFMEFSLSFSLLWTPLVRRLAAIVLNAMFISAIFTFGKIDAIGHSMIIATLIAVALDDQPIIRRAPILAPVSYGAALVVTLAAYYGGHALLYGTMIW
ncbi:MAG TPA: hypothetical protein VN832_01590 [Stellaceae bacterium]|nr:hypothetical protein [Stellaceae bacterium]